MSPSAPRQMTDTSRGTGHQFWPPMWTRETYWNNHGERNSKTIEELQDWTQKTKWRVNIGIRRVVHLPQVLTEQVHTLRTRAQAGRELRQLNPISSNNFFIVQGHEVKCVTCCATKSLLHLLPHTRWQLGVRSADLARRAISAVFSWRDVKKIKMQVAGCQGEEKVLSSVHQFQRLLLPWPYYKSIKTWLSTNVSTRQSRTNSGAALMEFTKARKYSTPFGNHPSNRPEIGHQMTHERCRPNHTLRHLWTQKVAEVFHLSAGHIPSTYLGNANELTQISRPETEEPAHWTKLSWLHNSSPV